jgi:hypothetical protein
VAQSPLTRRRFLKLSSALGATLALSSGCRSLLNQIGALQPTPPATTTTSPLPTPRVPATALPSPGEPPLAPTATLDPTATLSPTATPAPHLKLKAPSGGSKIGLHVVGGPHDGLDEFLLRCALADHPVAVVKCVDDFEAAFKAKRYSDKTVTVGRVNAAWLSRKNEVDMQAWEPPGFSPQVEFSYTTAQEAAEKYYALVLPTWKINPVIDVWETFNEFSWHWSWQADFYLRLMDLAEADGYRLGLWSPSAGNPPDEFYPEFARTCRRAKAHGNHILCVHEYSLDGLLKEAPKDMVTRYRQLYQYLEQEDAVIPLVISEAGENGGGGFTGVETFVDDFAWYDRQLSQDSYVIGCAAWTLGEWSGSSFAAALPALADYITGQPDQWTKTYLPLIGRDKVK